MSGETVLRYARDRVVFNDGFLESGFDHVPPECALEADAESDGEQFEGERAGEAVSGHVVDHWYDKGYSQRTSSKTMTPLHVKDLFELAHRDL